MNYLRYLRRSLWVLVFLTAAIFLGWVQAEKVISKIQTGSTNSELSPAYHLGSFEMVNHRGETVTEKTFLGKPSIYFFGFTNCPNVCPVTLGYITAMMKKLGPDADKLNVVFISVDPERDTASHIAEYLKAFDGRITGLTGTEDQTQRTAKAFSVFYKKVPLEGGDYTMDHTASILLFDARSDFRGTIDFEENRQTGLEKLQLLVKNAPSQGL